MQIEAAQIDEAGRRRAAVELVARHGEALKRAARRYSLCPEDAEDAYQRALEILLTKAPTDRARDLLAWTTTVVKHEALAVRRDRERLLGRARPVGDGGEDRDPVARAASPAAGPLERLERREEIARSREAIRALKPAERQTLALLGEGYSYAEIGAITGFSKTKVNRSLAEGRERFRRIVASSEDGSRCAEMRLLLSAFCDGEAGAAERAKVREHLRACGRCRAAVRAYRTVPATVAALCPLPLAATASGASGGGVAAGKGGWLGVLGKLAGAKQVVAVCAVAATTACVATGAVPLPDRSPGRSVEPQVEQVGQRPIGPAPSGGDRARSREREDGTGEGRAGETGREPAASAAPAAPAEAAAPSAADPVEAAPSEAEAAAPPSEPEPAPPPTEPVESAPPPAPAAGEAGGAAGEFGP